MEVFALQLKLYLYLSFVKILSRCRSSLSSVSVHIMSSCDEQWKHLFDWAMLKRLYGQLQKLQVKTHHYGPYFYYSEERYSWTEISLWVTNRYFSCNIFCFQPTYYEFNLTKGYLALLIMYILVELGTSLYKYSWYGPNTFVSTIFSLLIFYRLIEYLYWKHDLEINSH